MKITKLEYTKKELEYTKKELEYKQNHQTVRYLFILCVWMHYVWSASKNNFEIAYGRIQICKIKLICRVKERVKQQKGSNLVIINSMVLRVR
jgi:hypothetical protein